MKYREFPTRKKEADRPKKLGWRVIFRAVGRSDMKLLPYDTFELIVQESLPQVRLKLAENVGKQSFWASISSRKEPKFTGKVCETSFKIHRLNYDPRDYIIIPILKGTFEQHPSGTRISVKIRPSLNMLMFLLACIATAHYVTQPFKAASFWAVTGQEVALIVIAIIAISARFRSEVKRSKDTFIDVFIRNEAEDTEVVALSKSIDLQMLFKLIIIILILLSIGNSIYSGYVKRMQYEKRHPHNIADLKTSILTNDNAKNIFIRPRTPYNNGKALCLTKSYKEEFITLARGMKPAEYARARMDLVDYIDIDAGDVGVFQLKIITGGETVRATFSRYEHPSQKVLYEAEKLYSWVNNLPENSLQACSTDTSK